VHADIRNKILKNPLLKAFQSIAKFHKYVRRVIKSGAIDEFQIFSNSWSRFSGNFQFIDA
jgi:hypothetical protein